METLSVVGGHGWPRDWLSDPRHQTSLPEVPSFRIAAFKVVHGTPETSFRSADNATGLPDNAVHRP
jgi:hypothetical protein